MPKLGIGLNHGVESGRQLATLAKIAESEGYDSLWVTEDHYREEAFSMLGLLAGATEKIRLGLAVTNPYTRSPALLAMGAATLDTLSGGRFILGLGRSDRRSIEGEMGIPYGSPLQRMEEWVLSLRALFRGETVSNPRLGLKSISLGLKPKKRNLSIYLAASGPKTLRLVGRIADGVLLNAYSPVKYVGYAVRQVEKGAEENGRSLRDLEVACVLLTRMMSDSSRIMVDLKKRIASVLCEGQRGEMLLEKGGFDSSFLPALRRLVAEGNLKEAGSLVGDEVVRAFYLVGDAEECRRRVKEYREAGVTLPILLPLLSQFEEVAKSLRDS